MQEDANNADPDDVDDPGKVCCVLQALTFSYFHLLKKLNPLSFPLSLYLSFYPSSLDLFFEFVRSFFFNSNERFLFTVNI